MTLKEYLKKYGVTKAHIGREVCASSVSVSNWVDGTTMPSPMAIKRIEKATEGKVAFDDWVKEPEQEQ